MRVLAPSVMLVAGLAAFRGYAQGHQQMTPSSVSQIIEALFKLIVGLSLAWYLIQVLGMPDYIGAAGAIVVWNRRPQRTGPTALCPSSRPVWPWPFPSPSPLPPPPSSRRWTIPWCWAGCSTPV